MDSNLIWSQVLLTHSSDYLYTPTDFNFLRSSTPGQSYIGIIRGSKQIDIYNAVTLSYDHSLDIDWSGYTSQDSVTLERRFNSTSGEDQFVAGINYWLGTDPTGRIFIFDSSTTNVNNTPVYEFPHEEINYIHTHDTQGDASEELFVLKSGGELSLYDPSSILSTIWSSFVTGAQPLSSIVADFDGDTEDEFLLFTDQDELLTSVSFEGVIDLLRMKTLKFKGEHGEEVVFRAGKRTW